MQCPSCAGDVVDGAKYCHECGMKLPEYEKMSDTPPPDGRRGVEIPAFSVPPPPARGSVGHDAPELEPQTTPEAEKSSGADENPALQETTEKIPGQTDIPEPAQFANFPEPEFRRNPPQWVREGDLSGTFAGYGSNPPTAFKPPYPGAEPFRGAALPPYADLHRGQPEAEIPIAVRKRTGTVIAIAILCAVVILAGIVLAIIGYADLIGSKSGFSTYQELLGAYFEAFERSDSEAIAGYFMPEIRALAGREGLEADDIVFYMDCWYEDYGTRIVEWSEVDSIQISLRETYLHEIDIDASRIIGVWTITVDVMLAGDTDYWCFDFDIAQMDGYWYLIEVW